MENTEVIITNELISLITRKVNEAAKAIYGEEPDKILLDDNAIVIRYITDGCCGDPDEIDDNYIYASDLYKDLETIDRERREKAERERIRQEESRKQDIIERERYQREQRKSEYLKLKKEFGD